MDLHAECGLVLLDASDGLGILYFLVGFPLMRVMASIALRRISRGMPSGEPR